MSRRTMMAGERQQPPRRRVRSRLSAYQLEDELFKDFDFGFENLVFEGGGNKGLSYVGALEVLETAGIINGIKRVAGSSAGAITATLVATGYTALDMKSFVDENLEHIIVDHSCGIFSLIPNVIKGFGWNPGNRLLKWLGAQLRERTGNADATFQDILDLFGCELCIVVTNLSHMTTEYLHPKTSPDLPVRLAVRMSMAMPGVFQSVRHKMHGRDNLYVDGGLLCNYPIHVFDGWWLSMKPNDSFFKRLQNLDEYPRLFEKTQRFGTWNDKSLGLMLYSFSETELMKTLFMSRASSSAPRQPNTRLFRRRRKQHIKQAETQMERQAAIRAVTHLIQELHRVSLEMNGVICREGLDRLFNGSSVFTTDDQVLLFGDADSCEAFRELDYNQDGIVSFEELMGFVEKIGVSLQSHFLGYKRRTIDTLGDFVMALQSCLSVNIKRNYVDERDIDRTIGIDTDYIETNDYVLEDADKQFLIQAGARATRLFLKEHIRKHPSKAKVVKMNARQRNATEHKQNTFEFTASSSRRPNHLQFDSLSVTHWLNTNQRTTLQQQQQQHQQQQHAVLNVNDPFCLNKCTIRDCYCAGGLPGQLNL